VGHRVTGPLPGSGPGTRCQTDHRLGQAARAKQAQAAGLDDGGHKDDLTWEEGVGLRVVRREVEEALAK
jgi:hypothetical protein